MLEAAYLEFRTGQIVEIVPKTGFSYVFEAAGKTKPPGAMPGDSSCIIGDPDGGMGSPTTNRSAMGRFSVGAYLVAVGSRKGRGRQNAWRET